MNPFQNLEKENKPQKKILTPSIKTSLNLGVMSKATIGNKPASKPSSVSKFVVFNPPRPNMSKQPNSQASNISRISLNSNRNPQPGNSLQEQEVGVKTSPVNFTSNIPQNQSVEKIIISNPGSQDKFSQEIKLNLYNAGVTEQIETYPSSHKPVTSKSKRKFTEVQKEKEEAKKEVQPILTEFISLYDSYVIKKNITDEEFVRIFKVILSREFFINFSKLIPESMNAKGSSLLESSKFFILYIKFKIFEDPEHKMSLNDFIRLIDNCLLYDQNDMKLIYNFFIQFVGDNYKKEEIMMALERKLGERTVVTEIAELNEDHFKYLLSRPESFTKFELDSLLGSKYKNETLSKKMKLASINSAFKKKPNRPIISLELSEKKFNAGLVEESLSERVNVIKIDEEERERQSMSKSKISNISHPGNPSEIDNLFIPVVHEEHFKINSGSQNKNNEEPISEVININEEPQKKEISVHEISQINELREEDIPIIIDIEPSNKILSEKKYSKTTPEKLNISSQRSENKSVRKDIPLSSKKNIVTSLNNISISDSVEPVSISNNKLSYDAQIYYEELILKNKVDLEIEKSSLTFNKKTPKNKSNFKMDETMKFSIIPEVELKIKDEDVKMQLEEDPVEIPEEPEEEVVIVPVKSKNQARRAKSSFRPSKKKNISEEEEEKTAEDIVEEDTRRTKNNKSVKNKKRYQSDKKGVQQESKHDSSEDEPKEVKEEAKPMKGNKKKKTKSKEVSPEEETRRKSTVNSNQTKKGKGLRRSVSASAKESEEEEEVIIRRGREKSKANKKETKINKSKTAEKKKKKK